MTTLLSRHAPSPVPLSERTEPRDVSGNVWVQAPELDALQHLFDGVEWQTAPDVAVRRRPAPVRHST